MTVVLLRLQDCGAFSYSSGTARTTPSMEREKLHASSDYQQASFADLAQSELTERLVRIEGCQVIIPPEVKRTEKKDVLGKTVRRITWVCTFVAPPDLWTPERDAWISAATESKTDIAALNKQRLASGDMCTVIGIQTGQRTEPMATGGKQRHITFVKVTKVLPGIRGTSRKANVLPPRARHFSIWQANACLRRLHALTALCYIIV